MDRVTKVKFQWSKVASVLGSYKDFLHAYTMSLDSTNFSQGQIAAQLDTISRKFEQLKATVTGIATGMGASGLSAYIKNILSSLNAMAQSMQKIPTDVYKVIGAIVALASAVGATLAVVKLLGAGIVAVRTGLIAFTAAQAAATVATEGWAAAVTVATGGLNILTGLVVGAIAAFMGYNAIVSSNIEAIDKESQAIEDNVQIKRQEIEMSEKQGELIETLCNNHVKLQEALKNSAEGTEQHKRAEEDLAATDQELTNIIGEDAMRQIDWNGDLSNSINGLKNTHSEKTRQLRLELAQSLEAQAAYQEAEQQRIEATITNLSTEGTAWTVLGRVIEGVLHSIGGALTSMGRMLESFGDKVKNVFPDAGSWIASVGNDALNQGGKLASAESKWSSDRKDNAAEIAQLKNQLAQSKTAAAKARLEANAIRGTGGASNPYGTSSTKTDSGIIPESEEKAGSGGKGSKGRALREADNSIEAMLYRHMTKTLKLTHAQAVGELANIQQESGFNYQADNGTHKGLYQFDSNRWAEYQAWLANTGRTDSAVSQVDYRNLYESRYVPYEASMQQAYLQSGATTAEEYAAAFNKYIERSGEVSGDLGYENRMRNARELDSRFARRNGEENFDDVLGAREDAYKRLYEQFDKEISDLETERAKIGQGISAEEKKKIFEKVMGVGDGKQNAIFAEVQKAQKDYSKILLDCAKEEAKRAEAIDKAAETQVSAIEKMADSEIAFAEKLGLLSKSDVREYEYRKNESNYAKKKSLLSAELGSTVDMSKGTADDMLEAYQRYVYAQDELEAEHYAKKLFSLSRDVDATQKALNEMFKLEESYQEKRSKLEQEAFLEKSRYVLNFRDALVDSIESGLEGILNRTKSFADAMRDIFKGLVNSIIKTFSKDIADRVGKWFSKMMFPTKETGNKAGSFVDTDNTYGGNGGGSYDIVGWASNSLSLLGGGKGGKGGKGNPIINALGLNNFASTVKTAVQPGLTALRNQTQMTINGIANISQQGMQTIGAGVQMGTEAMSVAWNGYKTTQVTTDQMGNAAIVAGTESTAATVQATTMQMMGWLMAVMALFSIFGGGGGSHTSKSTSAVNLGRSPDSYYMTPTPVMQSTTFQVPSFDIGGNIEQDMFAMVHKGEMVLTPEQANVIRSTAQNNGSLGGGTSSNANIKSNINVSTVDSRGFDKVLRDYNRDLSKQVKKGIRNGYLNARGLV